MRDSTPRNWRNMRIAPAGCPGTGPAPLTEILRQRGNLVAELPGPDGIRWALVRRVQAEIAAGTYDTPQMLAKAEERMLAAWDAA
jgi:hypothetical protein